MSIIYRALSLGAGVQSSTLAMMLSQEDERLANAGYTKPDVAVFADTGWEPGYIYEHLGWLEEQLNFPLIRVSAGNIKDDLYAGTDPKGYPFLQIPFHIRNKDGGKGMLFRQCTSKYKIKPIQRAIKARAGGVFGRPFPKGQQVEQWMGISTDETSRMRDAREQWLINRYPLVDIGMSRDDCSKWWAEHYPSQPLRRSACVICPYRSQSAWAEIEKDSPSDYADAIEFDEYIRGEGVDKGVGGYAKITSVLYLHSATKPLSEAVESGKNAPYTINMFENECEGMCGV